MPLATSTRAATAEQTEEFLKIANDPANQPVYVTLTPNTSPKQATILITDCALPQYKNKTSNAIFKIEGKTLTIAVNEPGNVAVPTDFERSAVSQTRLMVLSKQ